jgi:hypothetical protein
MPRIGSDRARPISPEELNDLQALLESILRERKLPRGSAEAEDLAAHLIDLYQGGVRDAASLRTFFG